MTPKGLRNHHLTAERLPISARHGEVLALDIENGDRAVMVDDGGNDDGHAFPRSGAGNGDMMAGAPSGLRVGAIAQHRAAGETERQTAVVVPELAQFAPFIHRARHGPCFEMRLDEAGAAIEIARKMKNSGTGRPIARLVCKPSFCVSVKRSHVDTMPRMLSIPE